MVKGLNLVSIHLCGLISMLTSGLMEGRQVGGQQEKEAGGAGHNNQQLQTTGLYQGHCDEEKDKAKDKLIKNKQQDLQGHRDEKKDRLKTTNKSKQQDYIKEKVQTKEGEN